MSSKDNIYQHGAQVNLDNRGDQYYEYPRSNERQAPPESNNQDLLNSIKAK